MAISINWSTKVITVPQADLALISTGLYELDVDVFRQALKSLEDDADGMAYLDTHRHNTEVTLGGVTLARTVEIINGYTVTFENGTYAVRLTGANNNLADVMNVNSVSLRSNNSAGLIVTTGGAGASAQEVVDELMAEVVETGMSFKAAMRFIAAVLAGKISGAGTNTETFRNPVADSKSRIVATVDESGNRTAIIYDASD